MKSRLSSLLALTLLATAIAACTQTSPTVAPTGNVPAGGASAAPEAIAAPSATPSASTPAPSAAPTAAPAATGAGTLRGKVYDENGAVLSEAQVTVRSLSSGAPFETSVAVVRGSYVVNEVPSGVPVEVTVKRAGWTSRTQVTNVLPTMANVRPNELHFGGAGNANFLSRYPEIISVDPGLDATNVAADKLTYRLALSEPLDAVNRRRFERAVRVLPANDAANGGLAGTTTDLTAQEDNGLALTVLTPYQIQRGSVFLDDSTRPASVSWSADGLVATFQFEAPLSTQKSEAGKYQVVLISDGTPITDGDNRQLGTDEAGSHGAYPAAGRVVHSVFKPESLGLKTIPGLSGANAAWAATHLNVATFKVSEDKTAPQLAGVSVARRAGDTRLVLTFSEPMAAYNGTLTGFADASLGDLGHYSFAVAKRMADLDHVNLKGEVGALDVIDPAVTTSWGAAGEVEREFRFDPAAFTADKATATAGRILVEVDPLDAKRVFLTLVGRPNFFNSELAGLKTRVEGLQDPAGNAITAAQADRTVKTGQI